MDLHVRLEVGLRSGGDFKSEVGSGDPPSNLIHVYTEHAGGFPGYLDHPLQNRNETASGRVVHEKTKKDGTPFPPTLRQEKGWYSTSGVLADTVQVFGRKIEPHSRGDRWCYHPCSCRTFALFFRPTAVPLLMYTDIVDENGNRNFVGCIVLQH